MRRVAAGKVTLGVAVATLGTTALVDRFFGTSWFSVIVSYWPFFVISLGLEFIFFSMNSENKVTFSAGALILLALTLLAAWGYDQGYQVFKIDLDGWSSSQLSQADERVITLQESVDGIDTLVIESVGDVSVTGGSGSKLKGEIQISIRASDSATAKKTADSWTPEITTEANSLILRIDEPKVTPVSFVVTCRLEIPRTMNVRVKTVSGDVQISKIQGACEVGSVSGDISVEAGPVSMDLSTVSGDVDVTVAAAGTDVRVGTVSGDVEIDLEDVANGYFHIETTSGRIKVPNGLTQTQKLGGMLVEGNLGTGKGSMVVKTVSGDVNIR